MRRIFGVLVAGAFLALGCTKIENAVDCAGICDRYQTCYDASYDTGTCELRCRTNANSDSTYADKASDCDTCLGDKDCTASVFACGTECAGIVP